MLGFLSTHNDVDADICGVGFPSSCSVVSESSCGVGLSPACDWGVKLDCTACSCSLMISAFVTGVSLVEAGGGVSGTFTSFIGSTLCTTFTISLAAFCVEVIKVDAIVSVDDELGDGIDTASPSDTSLSQC